MRKIFIILCRDKAQIKTEDSMKAHKNLRAISAGESARIVAVDCGRKAQARLDSMGLVPGTEVGVLNNGRGPMIVCVGEGRVIVERGIAEKVIVA